MNQEADPLETITGVIKLLADRYNLNVVVNGNSVYNSGYFEGITDRQLLDNILCSISHDALKTGKVKWLDNAINLIHKSDGLNSSETILYAWMRRND